MSGATSVAHRVSKSRHVRELAVDFCCDVGSVNHQLLALWQAKCRVQDGPIFSRVDRFTAEHCFRALAHALLVDQGDQLVERCRVQSLAR
jgi:hypothetical protein